MKKVFLLLWGFLPFLAIAQQPTWTDYAWRTTNYPESDYFMAFVSGANIDEASSKATLDAFEEQAKSMLIQQIQVSLQTATEYNVANIDAASTEAFKMKSASLAKAEIAGLRTDRYFYRKKNEAYAIAWVKKGELKYYYKNATASLIENIKTKKEEADRYLKKNDAQQALKAYYETMPMFSKLDEAQFILVALGMVSEQEIRYKEGAALMLDVKQSISALQQSDKANIDDLAYFMAYGLFLQLGPVQGTLYLEKVGFETSGLTSEFSDRFHEALSRGLVKAGNYQVAEAFSSSKGVVISGSYWKEGEQLKVNCAARKFGQAAAANEVSLPLSWLRENHINWVPENYLRIALLPEITTKAVKPELEGRAGRPLPQALQVQVNQSGKAMSNVPVLFYLGDQQIGKASTNDNGVASLFYTPDAASRQTQVILGKIDVAAYIGLEPNSAFVQQLQQRYPISDARFMVKVAPLTVHVKSAELMPNGRNMDVNIIEPVLKEVLAAKGFAFTDQASGADLLVEIQAKARNGSNMQGIYFAFVDAAVSVMDLSDGRETWKQSFSSVKGGGADFQRAAIKAYETVAGQIKEAMPENIR